MNRAPEDELLLIVWLVVRLLGLPVGMVDGLFDGESAGCSVVELKKLMECE